MATQSLKDFVEERLLAYDSTIDLTAGSPAQYQVVDPIVRRFEPDPFEMSIEKFIFSRLTQEFPTVNFREGSGVYDLLVKAASVLMDPVSREVQLIKQGQSLANPELLADSEVDALVANVFVSRTQGGLATGTVRMYFNAPVALNISVGNVCYTADGLRFLPTTLQSITAEAMLFNQSGNLYYFDIQVTAEKSGTDYNIDKQTIVGINNLNTAVLVENPEAFESGLDTETTDELVQKAESSITERSLVTARGISARLQDQFEDLVHLQIVGMYDEEMLRDVITGGDLGPDLLNAADGFTEDDGDGDDVTYYFQTRAKNFVTVFGALGDVESPHFLRYNEMIYGSNAVFTIITLNHLLIPSILFTTADVGNYITIIKATHAGNLGMAKILAIVGDHEVQVDKSGSYETGMMWVMQRPPEQVEIESVTSTTALKLKTAIPADMQNLVWSIHQQLITIADIPGGILFSDLGSTLSIRPDTIHIGGAVDVYVRGTAFQTNSLVLQAISDEAPMVQGLELSGDTTYEEFVYDPSQDFPTAGVKPGYSLVIESGVNAGTKTILRVGVKPGAAPGSAENYLQIDPVITSTDPTMRYKIVDDLDIDLREPKTVRGVGIDLETIQLATLATTAAAIDFDALGVVANDTLEIKEGANKGTYTINSVSGTGNRNLNLAAQMVATEDNLSWEVYKAQSGITFPLVRIKNVEILDSSSQPTGYTVPYADPVDARSSTFSNAGRGTKVSTTDAITGIIATTDIDSLSYPLATTVLSISVNGVAPASITLTGTTDRWALLNAINAVVPNCASTINIDGLDYLTIRSLDRWLEVSANVQNSNLGLDPAGEDNRQIKSAANILDWTSVSYDLRIKKDVVFIRTGDNIGFLYLVSVAPTKLLAVRADESSGRLLFLQPNVNVSVAVGSRSYGKARVYFLEPTSFEVRGNWRPALKNTARYPANVAIEVTGSTTIAEDEDPVTYFTADVAGSSLRFFPDPDLKYTVLPAAGDDPVNNLTTAGVTLVESDASPSGDLGKNSRDAAIDFLTREIKVGDLVDVTYQPIQGSNDIRIWDGAIGVVYPDDLQGLNLILTLEDNPPKTITFTDQLTGPDDVVDQINTAVGETVAFIETLGSAKVLRLEADFLLIYHYNSTASSVFWTSPPVANVRNYAAANIDGYYTVAYIGQIADPTQRYFLELDQTAASGQAQHFIVYRPGIQRIHSTDMEAKTQTGLYYMDVELVSEGVGDEWNLDPDEVFTLEGYKSDGYRLIVEDENLSFSTEENVTMSLSNRIIPVGSSDRPDLATPLSGQNLQLNYESSAIVASIQSFVRSQLERVLDASMLVRHLQPHFINFTMTYRGGSTADVVTTDVEDYMDALTATDRVEVSDLQDIAYKRSATYVQNPIDLVAIIHPEDRKIVVERSQNYVTHGRLATFFPGTISITRETPTAL